MAMKVTKTAIHRLTVEMSCGCQLYSEFRDAQCKEPFNSAFEGGDAPCPMRNFLPCTKHATDPSVSMLEFIMGERLDEGIEDAQKAPVAPVHLHAVPGIEEGDTGGVVAVGGNVQSVAKVNKPVAVRPRPQSPPGIKTIQRTGAELAKVGAAPTHSQQDNTGIDMQMMDEAKEDTNITPHIFEALDFLDTKESGLLDEGEADDGELPL